MLRADLAELYIRLKQFDKAENVLNAAIEQADSSDTDTLRSQVCSR
jgi:hypothetical protein